MSQKLKKNAKVAMPLMAALAVVGAMIFMLVPGADPVVAAPCCSVCEANVDSCMASCAPGDFNCIVGCFESQRWCYNVCNLSC